MSIEKKKQYIKRKIIAEHGGSPHEQKCAKALRLIDLMFESNIPVGYWFVKMKGFKGSRKLKQIVEEYINNIDKKYTTGTSICFAGNQGTGKTMSSVCILKAALKRNFSVYYTTASDMMSDMTKYESNSDMRKILRESDFLVIDELDSRFFPSDAQKELFSSIYENIFRSRAHNNLPTIICTNETDNILNIFYGQSKQAIDSLNQQYVTVYPVVGTDFRKRINNEDITG